MEQTKTQTVFKSTLLFSFVKVFQIIIGIVKNKIIAILLGTEGVGTISVLNNTVSLLQAGSDLGVSQSAVRDVSAANAVGDNFNTSRIIIVVKKIFLFTSCFGLIITILLSSFLSQWTFGTSEFSFSYKVLSISVLINILTEGNISIFKGLRKLRFISIIGILGSIFGLVVSIPLYYLYGKNGIVASILFSSLVMYLLSRYFFTKIKIEKYHFINSNFISSAKPIINMGLALMFVGFLGLLFELIISAFIMRVGGADAVGIYKAGSTIITSYFGIILSSMTTDYYPRISAINTDNSALELELNSQTEIGLYMMFPVAIIFVFFSPSLIELLYTKNFLKAISYTDFSIYGIFFILYSNNLGMILLAKQNAKIFTIFSLLQRLLFIPVYFICYERYQLEGLGIAFILNSLTQLIVNFSIMRFRYNISLAKHLWLKMLLVIILICLTIYFRSFDDLLYKYFFGLVIILTSISFSYYYLSRLMNFRLHDIIKKFK